MRKDKANTGTQHASDAIQPPGRPHATNDEQLRFMAEAMPQKIFTVSPSGTIRYLNPQWYEYTGMTVEDLRGQAWRKVIHPHDLKTTEEAWVHMLKTGGSLDIEHRLKRHDSTYRWHVTQTTAMRDAFGHIVRWFGSSVDIHDSKLAAKRELQLTTRARNLTKQRQKLLALNAAKDEFISLASHQLRTPATAVKQYLSMILDGYIGEISPELRDMLERANASNDRQIDIVDDLLEVARVDSGKVTLARSKTNIVPLVQEVINEYSALLEDRKQRVSLEYNQSGISAPIDRSRMKMVLENILDNASKYSPHSTRIIIHVTKANGDVAIAITDEGVGIAPKDKVKLFGKFSRLHNSLSISVGGSGLGLYWAKRIVTLHGGKIKVASTPNKGSTFTVILPSKV